MDTNISGRNITKTAAWSAPVIAASMAAPTVLASPVANYGSGMLGAGSPNYVTKETSTLWLRFSFVYPL